MILFNRGIKKTKYNLNVYFKRELANIEKEKRQNTLVNIKKKEIS